MEKKDILCPDCEENYISERELSSFGKCFSCQRRENVAQTSGLTYVKFKDLPQNEKQRIINLRNYQRNLRNSKQNKINKKEVIKMEVKKDDNELKKSGRPQIYTPELIEEIKTIANENITPSQLLGILKGLHPDLPLTSSNLNNIINRNNIPHSSARGRQVSREISSVKLNDVKTKIDTNIDIDNVTNVVDNDEENLDVDIETNVVDNDRENLDVDIETNVVETNNTNNVNMVTPINTNNDIDKNVNDEPERFKPVRDEINGLLDIQFKKMHCELKKDYSTGDYINMMEMLIYLKKNKDDIIKNRRSQQNIMNAYQSDTLHEMENAVLEDGNTYLSDKMHILRKYRRYYENDYKNVLIMKLFLDTLDVEVLEKILNQLKRSKTHTDSPVFKPLVDTNMVDKYDWAQTMDLTSPKSNITITAYNPAKFVQDNNKGRPLTRVGIPSTLPPTNQLNSKMRKSLKIFRVSCKLSGGGYGVFKEWYRDYECTNSNIALAYATNTLKQLSATRKGMYWTDLDVVELNVNNDIEDNK